MRRLIRTIVVVFAATAGLAVISGSPASAADTIGIANYANPLCAEPDDGGNGAAVQLRPCSGSATQLWSRVSVGGGYYYMINQGYPTMCMDVRDGGNFDGAAVQIWSCTNTRGMHWRFVRVLTPFDNIRTKISDRCLDTSGIRLVVRGCNGATSQVWEIR